LVAALLKAVARALLHGAGRRVGALFEAAALTFFGRAGAGAEDRVGAPLRAARAEGPLAAALGRWLRALCALGLLRFLGLGEERRGGAAARAARGARDLDVAEVEAGFGVAADAGLVHALAGRWGAEVFVELRDLLSGQLAVVAGAQAFGADTGELDARQAHDREPHRFAHAVDLAVAAFGDRDLQPGVGLLFAHDEEVGRLGLLTVVEHDAVAQRFDLGQRNLAADLHDVGLGHAARRVQERLRELAVVGQQDHAAGVEVEPADGIDALRDPLHQVGDRGAAFWVAQRRDHFARLVEHVIDGLFGHDARAVHLDAIVLSVGARAELGDYPAVYAHFALGDQRFSRTAGSYAGLRENLLKTFFRHESPRCGPNRGATQTSTKEERSDREGVGPDGLCPAGGVPGQRTQ
jgi:hypothetical protein